MTHSSKDTSKSRLAMSATGKQKKFDETLDVHPHEKTFKEDNRVRWISNSRQLNKVKRQKQYPLLVIADILRNRLGTSFSLNLTLVCNTIHLSMTTKVKTPVPSSHHLVNTST